ncbi:protein LAX PANICLE 2-like isoform X2 [Phoenix dactylifera]|uniref:Protein LAX PANICLE 2-like isoform X2 n=1 Tax=Phoenix dactylifera TaxID=42345 RepID=A0A8B8JA98_PHODC|nr:protein LAX PANICLE 2-like isoform X2 [Phoenix dactylifera]
MMVPARNLLGRHYNSYGGHFDDFQTEFQREKASSLSGLMAEEVPQGSGSKEEEGEEAGSRSKEGDDDYQGWLQLGIGRRPSGGSRLDDAPVDPTNSTDRSRGEAVELNLLADRSSGASRPPLRVVGAPTMVPLFPPAAVGYRSAGATASSSSRPLPMLTSYNWGQFMCPSESLGLSVEIGGKMRVVSPPPRQQTGVWFLLQAAENQVKEPFLPQIPKSYLRIKDGRMTVGLLMKYLVEKLGLDGETQRPAASSLHYITACSRPNMGFEGGSGIAP